MEPHFIEEDGKRIGVGIGTAVHSEHGDLAAAIEAAYAEVLEQCRLEGFLWTDPAQVRARKADALARVRGEFGL